MCVDSVIAEHPFRRGVSEADVEPLLELSSADWSSASCSASLLAIERARKRAKEAAETGRLVHSDVDHARR